MSEKPKMYQNKITKEFHNNKKIYTSINEHHSFNTLEVDTIRKKINEIVNSNTFIYSKLVHIMIDNKVITRKIIGLYNNNLITIDNEYIPIANIQDIYI